MRTRRFIPLAVAAALMIVSCSDSDDAGPAATSSDSPAESAEATTPDTESSTPPPDTEGPETEPPVTDPDSSETPSTEPEPETTELPATEPTPTEPEPASYDFAAIDPIVSNFVDERDLNGAGLVVVDAEDGIVHEGYWGEFGPDRISLIASSSKMITAGILMRLADDGLLDMDAPVAEVADWGSGNPDITPAQLVSNSSGLVGLFPDPTYAPYLCQYIAAGTLQECAASIFTAPDDDADVIAPDTEFRYGGAQWQIAGAVAEAASGKSWAELVDEFVAEPCGLESLGYNNHFAQIGSGFDYPVEFDSDPTTLALTDNPNLEGGAYVTPPDYAELLLMHLRGGECDGETVLSPEAIDRLHADRIAQAYDGSAREDTGYGMGWWVDRETGRISDGGAYGSVPWLDLDEGYGAYLVIEADSGTGNELAALLYEPVADAVQAG